MVEDGFEMKKKIEEILVESGFAESRAAKMDVDDLLKWVCTSSTPPLTDRYQAAGSFQRPGNVRVSQTALRTRLILL